MAFVVSSKNYFEIPKFMEFAKENGAVALFWVCRDWGGNLSYTGEDLQVCSSEHPKYEELKQILKSVDLNQDYAYFSPDLLGIRNK